MDAKTLAEAFGGETSEADATELDESAENDDEAIGADLDIAMDPSSSPELRLEAFIRAVKAVK